MSEFLRLPAEGMFAKELEALKADDDKNNIPNGWQMSPKAVLKYIIGGKTTKGEIITPKYIGSERIVEICIATLLTDRALLLIGEPGTAKSVLSEHLSAGIYGDSTKVIQGTAGTTEEHVRYSWNYAMLLASGPSDSALIKSPVMRAMETGSVARIEEISRMQSEVQDALISILSEKRISIPELSKDVPAIRGFSVIATANTRDKGVNEMSSALKRRFNIVILPAPDSIKTEMNIVKTRVSELSKSLGLKTNAPDDDMIEKVVTIFRELRQGSTLDGAQALKPTSGVLSTAEAISLLINSMALASGFGNGKITDKDLAGSLQGAIVKDDDKDVVAWKEYLNNILKTRGEKWRGLYTACKELNK